MCVIHEMFMELVHQDFVVDQGIIGSNLEAHKIPVDRSFRRFPENNLGIVERKIPLDDDARWLELQTVPRTMNQAMGYGVSEAAESTNQS